MILEVAISRELQHCLEKTNRYILLHHFYDPFPVVQHYESVFRGTLRCQEIQPKPAASFDGLIATEVHDVG